MTPNRYPSKAQPLRVKKGNASIIKHLQAPLKGLSISSKMAVSDVLTASILDNWVIEKDRITVRPGIRRLTTLTSTAPIETIVPWHGEPEKYGLAQAGKMLDQTGFAIASGFTNNDWSWTTFSNLGAKDYTVMVNGSDGVRSWDGGSIVASAPITITSLANSNPARCTVAVADIGKFHNGDTVFIAGADTVHAAANGNHAISSVNAPANTFSLFGVDLSAAGVAQTTGLTAVIQGSMFKEDVLPPTGKAYVDPNQFHVVLSHMNRLWFADQSNLAVYYLPLQSKSGVLKELPLNALFRRGGFILAMYTWTLDGGAGMDDQLVIFSSNGEAIIYAGVDPDSDFSLTGIFRFDSPMSKNSVLNYGGDLYALIGTGLVPMSTMLRAEAEQLGAADKSITDIFQDFTEGRRSIAGWQVILDYDSGRVICNIPTGAPNVYKQMVRFMPDPVWGSWSNLPSRCWQWIGGRVLIGSDTGKVYELTQAALNDDGQPIVADMQLTWSMYGTAAVKAFKMVAPFVITDGSARPFVDIKVDYDLSAPFNQPDLSLAEQGQTWNTATWDVDFWASPQKARSLWQGVAGLGRVAAPRVKVSITNCQFSLAGFDIVFEAGAAVA